MAKVILKDVRLSFPDLFEAVQFQGQGEFRYGAVFLLPKAGEAHKAISAAIVAAAKEKFGDKYEAQLKAIKGNSNKYCVSDGDLSEYDGYPGHMVLSARRKQKDGRPLVLDRDKSPLTAADGKPYSGCYVNATVDIWAQMGTYSGIRCALLGVQFLRDGDAFAGSPANPDDFDDLGGTSEAGQDGAMGMHVEDDLA